MRLRVSSVTGRIIHISSINVHFSISRTVIRNTCFSGVFSRDLFPDSNRAVNSILGNE
jgi:hypothetical protein